MSKKVAVLAVNPVNGAGLFQYLEAFFENGISYKTFAVAETTQIKTNSGISLQTDDVVANLKGLENEYDALVFACGDAMPKFSENAGKQFNQDMLTVIKSFDDSGKILVGHCAAALLFDNLGIGKGKKVALHPFIKSVVKGCVGTDEQSVVEGNIYTAQTESSIPSLLPDLLKALK
ncbi:MAG: DJ-1/PfpI family protein [Prevotellaceae bacterium]|jgi:putative intracellular protease/amidase|nr:DJ-1/PfpI family protein [Prevotellaceae bacterium]